MNAVIKTRILLKLLLLLIALFWSNSSFAIWQCSENFAAMKSQGYRVANIDVGLTARARCPNTNTRYDFVIPYTNGSTTYICNNIAGNTPPSGFVTIAYNSGNLVTRCSFTGGGGGSYRTIKVLAGFDSYERVCTPTIVPSGWVVSDKTYFSNCNGAAFSINSWTLRKPWASTIVVCAESTVPAGYVITHRGTSSSCANQGAYTGSTITITNSFTNGQRICGGTNGVVPPGYVITYRWANHSDCGGPAYQIWLISRLTSGQQICNGPYGLVIPNGFFITQRNVIYSRCANQPGYTIATANPTGMWICGGIVALPNNYVITSRVNNYSACGGPRYYIKIPSPSGEPTVCQGSPIPAGWGFTNFRSSYSGCGGYSAWAIGPIVSGSTICSNSTIPDGMVVTRVSSYPSYVCRSPLTDFTVAYPHPTNEQDVCYPTVTPPGYVIVRHRSTYSQCGTFGGWTIQTPSQTGETLICQDSPIPEGFYVTRELSSVSQCGTVRSGYWISQITGDGPYILCNGSDIPPGYVIISRGSNYAHCSAISSSSGFTIIRPTYSSTITTRVCDGTPYPEGFVIVSRTTNFNCRGGAWNDTAYNIKLPNSTGTTIICNHPEVPVPAGYGVVATGPGNSCGIFTDSTIMPNNEIPPTSSPGQDPPPPTEPPPPGTGGVVPPEFIGTEPDVVPGSVPAVQYDCTQGTVNSGFATSARRNGASCP